jgi:hypothetical protein
MRLRFLLLVVMLSPTVMFAQNAELSITSFPPGASVSIDGVTMHDKDNSSPVTPLNVSLSLGPHTVHVGLGDPGWQPYDSTINIIKADNDLSVVLIPIVQTGPQGPMGLQGIAATIQVGTVAVAGPNASPSVNNSGTPNNAVLNFVLPAGVMGPQGLPGANGTNGVNGKDGAPGPQGIPGPAGAASTVPGPQGIQGIPGVAGAQGATGAVGPQGAASTVPGPQGPQGPAGANGAPGPAGAASTVPGPQGPSGPTGPAGISFSGYWSPSGVPYPQGAIVLRTACSIAQWSTPPSCNQGGPGPFFCAASPACVNADPIMGDPIVDNFDGGGSGEWTRIGDAPTNFVAAQVFSAPITTTLTNPAIIAQGPEASSGYSLAGCYNFTGTGTRTGMWGGASTAFSGCSDSGLPSPNLARTVGSLANTGFDVSTATGTYHTLNVSLASAWSGIMTIAIPGGVPSLPVDGPLTVTILAGTGYNVVAFSCQVPQGLSTCTSGYVAPVALTNGVSPLGIELSATSSAIGLPEAANAPTVTITLQ